MSDARRTTVREIAQRHLNAGDPLGWFEELYVQAAHDPSILSWADWKPNPNLVEWLNHRAVAGPGRAIVVGCGLGDDAEELARRGFETTAFDISTSAVAWCRRRFPHSSVSYVAADLLATPAEWRSDFNLVLESYTLQVLPPRLRADAAAAVASLVAPDGMLLVIARGREPSDPEGNMPWPLTKPELSLFETLGLKQLALDDYLDAEDPPVRRFRATYRRD